MDLELRFFILLFRNFLNVKKKKMSAKISAKASKLSKFVLKMWFKEKRKKK